MRPYWRDSGIATRVLAAVLLALPAPLLAEEAPAAMQQEPCQITDRLESYLQAAAACLPACDVLIPCGDSCSGRSPILLTDKSGIVLESGAPKGRTHQDGAPLRHGTVLAATSSTSTFISGRVKPPTTSSVEAGGGVATNSSRTAMYAGK